MTSMPTAQDVLEALKSGNSRYVQNLASTKKIKQPPPILVEKQAPIAIVLGCSDARVPVELVFDQPLGNLFVIRVAGNIVAPSQIGSVEFAASKFGTPLVVVLGHSDCGAVGACLETLDNPKAQVSPHLGSIVDRIRPSILNIYEIEHAKTEQLPPEALLTRAVTANVMMAVGQLKTASDILSNLIRQKTLKIVGAKYNLTTGKVEFFD